MCSQEPWFTFLDSKATQFTGHFQTVSASKAVSAGKSVSASKAVSASNDLMSNS